MFRANNQLINLRYGLKTNETALKPAIRHFCAPVKKERIVLLGSGWAGHRFLRDLDTEKYDIRVVSPRNHMLFTPLLSSAAVGTLEIRSVCQPIRPLCIEKNGHFYQAGCMKVDLSTKTIECSTALSQTLERHDFNLKYDKLIIACGMETNDFGIEGVRKYACYMKETGDARRVRATILKRLEEASFPGVDVGTIREKLTFVVVGGGPSGVEFAAELADFVEQDCRKQYPEVYAHATVMLIEGNELLGTFTKRLRDYALKRMRKRKVDVRLGKRVVKVDEKKIWIDDDTTCSTSIPYGLLVWTGGVKSHFFVKELQLPHNGQDQILTNDFLEVSGQEGSIYAMGDCAGIVGLSLPPTAAVANSQAKYLANCFNKGFDKEIVGPYLFKSMGQMAWLGNWAAAIDLGNDKYKFPFSGFLAALSWRMAYFSMQGSVRNRCMVPFDWFKSLVFGRDLTRF